MHPVDLYFAGGGECSLLLVKSGVKNKLVSYYYPEQLKSWLQFSSLESGKIILDSGAFSAWNKGVQIDIDSYISYAHKAIEDSRKSNKLIRIVNLDVIPGRFGESTVLNKIWKQENKEIIENAARQGYKNLKIIKSNGITPMHVFHQGEHLKWLDRMLELTDYVGLSPANDMGVSSRKAWLETAFTHLSRNGSQVKVHGFAVWMRDVLKRFPWTSCDAITWRKMGAMGIVAYPQGGFQSPDYSKPPVLLRISSKSTGKGVGCSTEENLQLLERDGYTYQDLQHWKGRTALNIQYFLGLEAWVNGEKRNLEYTPRFSLNLEEKRKGTCGNKTK